MLEGVNIISRGESKKNTRRIFFSILLREIYIYRERRKRKKREREREREAWLGYQELERDIGDKEEEEKGFHVHAIYFYS